MSVRVHRTSFARESCCTCQKRQPVDPTRDARLLDTRNDPGQTICSEQSDALLMNALEIQAKSNHLPLSVGLAYGNGLVLDSGEWISVARMQAERMATLGSHDYITASSPFVESLEALPEGIGIFPLNKSVQVLIGFPSVLIRDFREPNQ